MAGYVYRQPSLSIQQLKRPPTVVMSTTSVSLGASSGTSASLVVGGVTRVISAIAKASYNADRGDSSAYLQTGDGENLLTGDDEQILVSSGFPMLVMTVARSISANAACSGAMEFRRGTALVAGVASTASMTLSKIKGLFLSAGSSASIERATGKILAAAGLSLATLRYGLGLSVTMVAAAGNIATKTMRSVLSVTMTSAGDSVAQVLRIFSTSRVLRALAPDISSVRRSNAWTMPTGIGVSTYISARRNIIKIIGASAINAASMATIVKNNIRIIISSSSSGIIVRNVSKFVRLNTKSYPSIFKKMAVSISSSLSNISELNTYTAIVLMNVTSRCVSSIWSGVYRVGSDAAGRLVEAVRSGARIVNARTGKED